jgi:hypothetical protein
MWFLNLKNSNLEFLGFKFEEDEQEKKCES